MKQPLEWKTMRTLPPMRRSVLIWRGMDDSSGGFPLIGRLYEDPMTGEKYICYNPKAFLRDDDGTTYQAGYIFKWEFQDIRWAEIPVPKAAQAKYNKYWQKMEEQYGIAD